MTQNISPTWGKSKPIHQLATDACLAWSRQLRLVTSSRKRDRGTWDIDEVVNEAPLRRVEEALQRYEVRTSQQCEMHHMYIAAMLRFLVKKPSPDLLLKYGVTDDLADQNVCALTPRRFGKSHAFSQLIAALMYMLPTIEILIFSGQLQMSKNLLAEVPKRLSEIDSGWLTTRRIVRNTEMFAICGYGTTRDAIDETRRCTVRVKSGTSKITAVNVCVCIQQ